MFNNYLSKYITHLYYFNQLYDDTSIQNNFKIFTETIIFVETFLFQRNMIINKRCSSIKIGYGKIKSNGGNEWKYKFKKTKK